LVEDKKFHQVQFHFENTPKIVVRMRMGHSLEFLRDVGIKIPRYYLPEERNV